MAMFGNNENEQPAPRPSGPPTDLVLRMRGQGFSNNQIVQTLQREGYKSHDIFDAMNQADIKGSVSPVQPGQVAENPQPENPMQMQAPQMGESKEEPREVAMPAPTPAPMFQSMPQEAPPHFGTEQILTEDKERIEEIVETIVADKWEELAKDIRKVIDWKEITEERVTQLNQKFNDLKENFDTLHKGIIGKIGEYDESLSNVGTEIKALEKVFQKILPTLTENVHELGRITQDMKGKKK